MSPTWPVAALAGISGLALGSYTVTAALRWARQEPSSAGRSRCDACRVPLGFHRTVPLASYVWQRGVCASCRAPIDRTHLGGELVGAALIVAAALTGGSLLRTLLLSALALVLLAATVTDLRVRRLPDLLTGAAAALCAALAWDRSGQALLVGLAAAVATFLALTLVRRASMGRGRDPGLGMGDVKLLSAMALWLGLGTPWALAAAALVGLVAVLLLRPADGRIPFGPIIAAASLVVGFAQELGAWPSLT